MRAADSVTRAALFAIGLALCLSHCSGPARAAEVEVTPELVCTVQNAIRWRAPAWTPQLCHDVAIVLSDARQPATLLAITVLESQMRPGAIAWVKLQGRDGSASAPRSAGRPGEHYSVTNARPGTGRARARGWTSSAGATPRAGDVADVGIAGVRCVLGVGQRCVNGQARGLHWRELLDPVVNIRIADQVLRQKHRVLGARRAVAGYNGDLDGSNGYAASVGSIVVSFSGVEVRVRRQRVRELARKIADAVRRERKS